MSAPECGCKQPDCFACEIASLRTWLLPHGLHIVSEADRKVLEACAGISQTDAEWLTKDVEAPRGWIAKVAKAELARRRRCKDCGMITPAEATGQLHHIGCGTGAMAP